jgi:ribosome-binding protein aMBF1 (putative translation factor)
MPKNAELWKRRGNMIKTARTNKGLLQKDVADFLKVKPNTISGYENGDRKMDFDDVKKLCRFLGIELNSF